MAPDSTVEFPRGSYERGYYVGEQRALSRQELGLPLDRPSTDAEILDMAIEDLIRYRESRRVDAYPEWVGKDGWMPAVMP